MLMTAKEYLKEYMGIEMPDGDIDGQWFVDNRVPMIVSCCECESTMALPSAMIDTKDGSIICHRCC